MEAIEKKVDRLHELHILLPILDQMSDLRKIITSILPCFTLILDRKIRYSDGIFSFNFTF